MLVADNTQIKIFGYSHEFKFNTEDQSKTNDGHNPILVISYDINSKSDLQFEEHKEVLEEHEEIIFVHFLSDYDPSLMILVTYNRTLNQSYIKFLKIYNKIEQEEDWKSNDENHENEEKTYSMVED